MRKINCSLYYSNRAVCAIVPEPVNWDLLRLSQVYIFEPVPENVDPHYILGVQGNVWSEFIPSGRQNDYMTWQRAIALSEILWSPKTDPNFDEFVSRLETKFPALERDSIDFVRSIYDPIIKLKAERA